MPRKPPLVRHDYPVPEYVYRRRLEPRELLPAVGAAVGVGLAAFYVARLFLQRTPLLAQASRRDARSHPTGHE